MVGLIATEINHIHLDKTEKNKQINLNDHTYMLGNIITIRIIDD